MVNSNSRYKLYEKNSREEEAELSLKVTSFSPGVATFLVIVLLIVAFGELLLQGIYDIRQGKKSQLSEITTIFVPAEQVKQAKSFMDYWNLMPPVKNIMAFENSLEEESVVTQNMLPKTQNFLTGVLGAGNEQAYRGKNGWLYYRPDVEYFTSRGFLDPDIIKQHERSGIDAIQPNPLKAIFQLNEDLQKRNISLIIMPAPSKPMIYPEELTGRYAANSTLIQNPSYQSWKKQLQAKGITVFDSAEALLQAKTTADKAQFLKTDTHWSPAGMEVAAQLLAKQLAGRLTPQAPAGYTSKNISFSGQGDLTTMLKLPTDQKFFPNEKVTLQQVHMADGSMWKADRNADVLLLGDSFCNIFSLGGMGWGEGAGFAERLSFAMQRPLDKIVINAGGAFAARQQLWQEMMRGQDRLAGKKVVIYEFALRDLAFGDWKMLPLPKITSRPPPKQIDPLFTLNSITPAEINVDKKEQAEIIFASTVAGSYQVNLLNTDGTTQKLAAGICTANEEIKVTWNGQNDKAMPVLPGSYTITIEGSSADGKTIPGVQGTITVTGATEGLKLQLNNVNPTTFDPVAGEKTTFTVVTPEAAEYMVTVLSSTQKTVATPVAKTSVTKAGKFTASWNGKDRRGKAVPAGSYIIKVEGRDSNGKEMIPASSTVTIKAKETAVPVEKGIVVQGKIKSLGKSPTPGSVPYKDCIIAMELSITKVTAGNIKTGDVLVYIWGMRDNKLKNARLAAGQTVTMKLTSWNEAEGEYGGYNRVEPDNTDALFLDPYWGEVR